jgi:hypothetical protein
MPPHIPSRPAPVRRGSRATTRDPGPPGTPGRPGSQAPAGGLSRSEPPCLVPNEPGVPRRSLPLPGSCSEVVLVRSTDSHAEEQSEIEVNLKAAADKLSSPPDDSKHEKDRYPFFKLRTLEMDIPGQPGFIALC